MGKCHCFVYHKNRLYYKDFSEFSISILIIFWENKTKLMKKKCMHNLFNNFFTDDHYIFSVFFP